MNKPRGMNENEFERKLQRGEFDKGAHPDDPQRGPDHPEVKAARDKRAAATGDAPASDEQ